MMEGFDFIHTVHEAGRLEVEDRADDVGDLAHMANRVRSAVEAQD
jgi:hypothetical protein